MRAALLILGLFALVLVARGAAVKPPAVERERSIAVDGQARTYTLIARERGEQMLPLVIVFHGGSQTAERARRYSRFDEFPAIEPAVVVYPQGLDNSWNDGRESPDIAARGRANDVAFTAQIIDQLVTEKLVDPGRVFLTGASNGGMMSLRAACELGDKIAGIAPVVANLPVDWDCRAKTMPALFINGTDDQFVPFEGGRVAEGKSRKDLGSVRSVADTIAVFKRMNGCTGVKESKTLDAVERDKTVAVITDYDCTLAPLKQIEIQGGGHTWPGARTNIIADWVLGKTSDEVNATDEIWKFFKALPSR